MDLDSSLVPSRATRKQIKATLQPKPPWRLVVSYLLGAPLAMPLLAEYRTTRHVLG